MKVLVKGQCECVFHEGKAVLCPMGNAIHECNMYGINKTHNTTLSLTGLCCIVKSNLSLCCTGARSCFDLAHLSCICNIYGINKTHNTTLSLKGLCCIVKSNLSLCCTGARSCFDLAHLSYIFSLLCAGQGGQSNLNFHPSHKTKHWERKKTFVTKNLSTHAVQTMMSTREKWTSELSTQFPGSLILPTENCSQTPETI